MATVICPNCGGENNVTNRDGQECAYCGTMLYLPTPKKAKTKDKGNESNDGNKNLSDAKFIVPIASKYSTEKEVRNALNAFLVKQEDVPDDIFDHLEIQTVKWIYLPMWRYNGSITTEWSCDEVVYRKRKVGEEPKYDSKGNLLRIEAVYETYEDYLPKSGHGQTSFDILVPVFKSVKEKLPYRSIDFNTITGSNAKQLKDEVTPVPASASIRKVTVEIDSETVLTNMMREINRKAEKCSYGNFIPRTSGLPHSVIMGRECVHEQFNVKYKLNENGTIGELYYLPFVYVVYSYKGNTYKWGFMLNPDCAGVYDTPTSEDNTNDEDIDVLKEKSNQIRAKWNIFLFLSGVLSFLVGMIIFLVRNISLYERIGKRYCYQESMFSLLGIYKRRENLIKHGADKKTISEIDAQIQEEYDDEEDEGEDDRTPKSIAEIHEYFAETEVLRQTLLKRMKRFWVWYISLIVIVGGSILGYIYYSDKMAEEQISQESQRQEDEFNALIVRVEGEIREQFISRFQNKTFEGAEENSILDGQIIKIKVLDNNRLEYQLGSKSYNGLDQSTAWSSPKIIHYTLDIDITNQTEDRYCVSAIFRFDEYESSDLLNGDVYGTHKFDYYTKLTNKTSNKTFLLNQSR